MNYSYNYIIYEDPYKKILLQGLIINYMESFFINEAHCYNKQEGEILVFSKAVHLK